MPPSMKLRRASIVDAAALADFAATAFWDTYGHVDDPKGIAKYVAEALHAASDLRMHPRSRDDHALGRG